MKNTIKVTDSEPKTTPKPLLSHDAKVGLWITLIVLIGVVIWVVVELKMYQN